MMHCDGLTKLIEECGEFLEARTQKKLELFKSWDNGPNV